MARRGFARHGWVWQGAARHGFNPELHGMQQQTTKAKTMNRVTIALKGLTPLIMHNNQAANPLSDWAVKIKELTSKRGKVREDYLVLAEVEMRAGAYWHPEHGLHLPSANLIACFLGGAKKRKLGRQSIALLPDRELFPFQNPNPKSLDAFVKDPRFTFQAMVANSGVQVLRTRPIIPAGWTMACRFLLDTDTLSAKDCESIWEIAGNHVGMGDWRPSAPKKPGVYGRFQVEEFRCE